jgi:type I site-specific restriction-modification system R (restriction) subunit
MVGTDKRIALVAEDLVKHWEARYAAMEGKAMVVWMSRRICVDLYEAIRKLRPAWHHDDAEVQHLPQRNLAVELLQKLLNNGTEDSLEEIPRPVAVVRRNAGDHDPQISEPHDRSRAGDC